MNKIHSPCNYCGVVPEFPFSRNGIDRMDNNKSYVLNNIVSCCWIFNRSKGQLTIEEFNEWSILRYNHLAK